MYASVGCSWREGQGEGPLMVDKQTVFPKRYSHEPVTSLMRPKVKDVDFPSLETSITIF